MKGKTQNDCKIVFDFDARGNTPGGWNKTKRQAAIAAGC